MTLSIRRLIHDSTEKVLGEKRIEREEALRLATLSHTDLVDLFAAANRVRDHYRGTDIDLCSIMNARSGACSEDCRFCAQSSHYHTDAPIYDLVDTARIEEAAKTARENGARRFCIVTSGKGIDSNDELHAIGRGLELVRSLGLKPCATLGTLSRHQLRYLKDAGLNRYHHNIETSREFFPEICSTHTFDERVELLGHARELGLSLCSGGILGMGETMQDRVSMAFTLRDLDVDSVPLNFLMPIAGTPLGDIRPIKPLEALHSISLFRMILPDKEIRICGGRGSSLGSLHPMIFQAGADGFMIGNYLTRTGLDPKDDLTMLHDLGLTIKE
ncbi:MAG: biotin synthase BioB [Nitrospirota bacterium]|nr:biotin synthase BioB [Nitrospirota bacterium]